ncbi:uncharacterized protein I206_103297 [Kwoniella pini CBS 10737]|uniref:Uncharacterized protein n=1 Tax=Kwoniella pini CBS 10737 TaxID=1296096 RepID=A0A1B9I9W0_9TREE|nr:uncharacterized protein I206_01697 [Kwoniella pini CBS 10737]OCF52408.1 hypothetical protein I206_01697 [Kwoniella pini CBS 10737]
MSFFNPFRRAKVEREEGKILIQVKWGKEKFNIPIPSPSLTPLSTLLATLSAQTSLPLDQLKLIYKGAVLKDSSLTISSYGIEDGSTLVLIGKNGDIPSISPSSSNGGNNENTINKSNGAGIVKKKIQQPETDQENILIEWINNLIENLLNPLIPSILTFISQTNTSSNNLNKPKIIPKFEILQKEHARLSENLLKALLDLDGININNSNWIEARKARKLGVKKIQNELNKVDEAWGERKRIGG